MDHLRHGIHLRGYAQKNPKQEYKRESFALFQDLLDSIKRDSIRVLSHVQVRREDPAEEEARLRREAEEMAQRMQFKHEEVSALQQPEEPEQGEPVAEIAPMPVRTEPKVGADEFEQNGAPAPRGSGGPVSGCRLCARTPGPASLDR